MIMYSIVPVEQIFEGFDNEQEPLEEISIDGILMQVQPISSRQAKIVRIISPDPQDFLNPSYAPGEMIHYQPSLAKN